MSSVVEQIKARLSIQDVVGSYIKLEGAGQNLKAKCPFHSENTASFFVSPARASYYCFGCNKGGDILTFVQEVEGLDFRNALKILADRAGVIVDNSSYAKSEPLNILREIMEESTIFYIRELQEDDGPMKYLLSRGLSKESIGNFRIGYAPDSWSRCSDYLLAKGYSGADIERAGITIKGKNGKAYDRFRQRIIFPINDPLGRVVAFTGRIFDTGIESITVKDIGTQGKYVNSPQTELYNKSGLLYGYDKAKVAIRKNDMAILVEGQTDAIMSHQIGIVNTVAVSGTALTSDHLSLIKRLTRNLILAFDADIAGIESSRRAVLMALSLDMDVRIAVVPNGKDPADTIESDPDAWRIAIEKNVHVVDYYLSVLIDKTKDPRALKRAVELHILPLVARIASPIDRAHFVSIISARADIPEQALLESLRTIRGVDIPSPRSNESATDFASGIAVDTRKKAIIEKIFAILFWQESEPAQAVVDTSAIRLAFKKLLDTEFDNLESTMRDKSDKIIFEAELQYGQSDDIANELERLLSSLESENLRIRFQNLMRELKAKTPGQDRTKQILEECQKLGARLEILKKQEIRSI